MLPSAPQLPSAPLHLPSVLLGHKAWGAGAGAGSPGRAAIGVDLDHDHGAAVGVGGRPAEHSLRSGGNQRGERGRGQHTMTSVCYTICIRTNRLLCASFSQPSQQPAHRRTLPPVMKARMWAFTCSGLQPDGSGGAAGKAAAPQSGARQKALQGTTLAARGSCGLAAARSSVRHCTCPGWPSASSRAGTPPSADAPDHRPPAAQELRLHSCQFRHRQRRARGADAAAAAAAAAGDASLDGREGRAENSTDTPQFHRTWNIWGRKARSWSAHISRVGQTTGVV